MRHVCQGERGIVPVPEFICKTFAHVLQEVAKQLQSAKPRRLSKVFGRKEALMQRS